MDARTNIQSTIHERVGICLLYDNCLRRGSTWNLVQDLFSKVILFYLLQKKNEGVVMVNFYDKYINCYPNNNTLPTLDQVASKYTH